MNEVGMHLKDTSAFYGCRQAVLALIQSDKPVPLRMILLAMQAKQAKLQEKDPSVQVEIKWLIQWGQEVIIEQVHTGILLLLPRNGYCPTMKTVLSNHCLLALL